MALKLTRGNPKEPRSITSDKIPMGETFFGDFAGKNILFLRMYGGMVSLDNPMDTWNLEGYQSTVTIENYRPVDIVGEVREIE